MDVCAGRGVCNVCATRIDDDCVCGDGGEVMTNEVVVQEPSVLSIVGKLVESQSIDVYKVHKLLEMQERIMAKNAEMAFNRAMAQMQPELPEIKHTAKIEHKGTLISTYAKYEDIDREIKPFYSKHGFSISFDSKQSEKGVIYFGTLSHVEGHSRTAEMILPADTSGAKNSLQAMGSTISYAKRYLVGMLLNLVTVGEDDDGKSSTKVITHEQAVEIDVLLRETSANRDKFLKDFMGVDDVRNIRAQDYQKAINALQAKKAGKK